MRPKLHFTPRTGWTNDPNGLFFDGNVYHLFAQHNPDATVWGPMHWLHATSPDLLHWTERGISLFPNELGTMFSGSMVRDPANTAGFGTNAYVAMFTQHGATQTQSLAYSIDGHHFTCYPGNPIVENPGIADFRDPKVFWDDARKRWAMALAARDHIQFYASPNLKCWLKTGEWVMEDLRFYGDVLECPDLFELSGDGLNAWALTMSVGASGVLGGGKVWYLLGAYDGETFHPFQNEKPRRLDVGPDDYAGVTFNGLTECVYIGWAANPAYADTVPDANGYRGQMTLPRRLSLVKTVAGPRVAAMPVLPDAVAETVSGGYGLPDAPLALRLVAEDGFHAAFENDRGERLAFGLDEQGFWLDRRGAGTKGFSETFDRLSFVRAERAHSGQADVLATLDGGILELYADGGLICATMLAFPSGAYDRLRLEGAKELSIIKLGI
ncbi:MAG: glycoside hydrolase family 32 protein [Oscillospiraceae bacterium]|jgi:fructan beta-fructosidase|nr:glycoside hydrolase family 32 protein [Oscillospiraceae bacterium]